MTSCRQRTRRSRCRNQNLRSFRLDLEGLESRVLLYLELRATSGPTTAGSPTASCQTVPSSEETERAVPDPQRWPPRRPGNLSFNRPPPSGRPPQRQSGAGSRWRRGGQHAGDQQDDPRFGDIRIGAIPCRPASWPKPFFPRRPTAAPPPVTSSSTPKSTGRSTRLTT